MLALATVYLIFKKNYQSDKFISAFLSFLWLWMGTVYHFIFFLSINKGSYLFGVLFIIEGVLLFYAGYIKQRLSYSFRSDLYGITGMLMILFSLVIYPVIAYFLHHTYPSSPTFGLPCPTTIFTFGLLLQNQRKTPFSILIIPLLWSLIGSTAVFLLGVAEDISLLISASITTLLVFLKNRKT
ncbi:DUF6064 family protein [Terrimonas pollutisoli]|uniref:DUF6064 family protein n=1 Tax=Terrimonas pollutisoli TaxID=3034147 RepID=UPI0023ECACEA|nr:DUF6064 family protein [Terrimonas sp. H1YJ31]